MPLTRIDRCCDLGGSLALKDHCLAADRDRRRKPRRFKRQRHRTRRDQRLHERPLPGRRRLVPCDDLLDRQLPRADDIHVVGKLTRRGGNAHDDDAVRESDSLCALRVPLDLNRRLAAPRRERDDVERSGVQIRRHGRSPAPDLCGPAGDQIRYEQPHASGQVTHQRVGLDPVLAARSKAAAAIEKTSRGAASAPRGGDRGVE